jgi:hypothetical protein
MRRTLTINEQNIIKHLREHGRATYADIEPIIIKGSADIYWSTFSTICSLVQSGIITSTNYPSVYTLTKYGRTKALEITL